MRWIFILTIINSVITAYSITANLKIVQYEPVVFELSFSQKVQRPQFQLLFNNFQNVPYQFLTQNDYSQSYYLQISSVTNQLSKLQVYTLIFNNPLNVGNGKLDLGFYSIEASKSVIRKEISNGYAIFIMVIGYLLSNFTLLGNIILQYSQVYVLLMFKSRFSTTLYQDLSRGLLLIPQADLLSTYSDSNQYIFECLAIPLLLIYAFGLLGYVLKRVIKVRNTIKINVIFEIFTHNAFVNVCFIFSPNLLFNSAQFIDLSSTNSIQFSKSAKIAGIVLSYFSILTLGAITYLQVYILNPKINQNSQSWEKYILKDQFKAFARLHEGLNLTNWFSRNIALLILLKKLLIVSIFFTVVFQYLLIYLQFASLYYFFTIRPYKEQIDMNIYFVARLLAFVVQGLIVLGDIYFSLGAVTFNYQPAAYFLTVRDAIFLAFVLVILGVIVRQIYQKISNFNYKIRLVREQNEFKLQILEKNINSGAFEVKRNEQIEMQFIVSHPKDRKPLARLKKSHVKTQNNLEIAPNHSLKKRKSHANLQEVQAHVCKQFDSQINKNAKQMIQEAIKKQQISGKKKVYYKK